MLSIAPRPPRFYFSPIDRDGALARASLVGRFLFVPLIVLMAIIAAYPVVGVVLAI